jgi:cell division protein FtsI (penicillin-binding protein 3)
MAQSRKLKYPGRLIVIISLVTVWCLCVIGRLYQLQVLRHKAFIDLAGKIQILRAPVLAPRGVLYDAHMDELATSVTVSTVHAEPRRIKNIREAADSLAAILDMDAGDLYSRLTDKDRQVFQVIKRRIDPKAEAQIIKLGIDGVYLVEESMRVYPNRELACHAIGFVNMNGDGGSGLELQYDRDLKGQDGRVVYDIDARRRSFHGTVETPPVQGHSLVLSIDRNIQYIAAKELAAGVEKAQAAAGVAVVMESDTGRILALACHPYFNSNTYNEYSADYWRNRAISDIYEPGSTFKVVVAAAALEAGLTRPDEMIDCQMGSIVIGRHVFHDIHRYGLLSFLQILEKSSNVGAAKLGLRLGEERLYESLMRYGFGARSGIDLPGEIVGLVRDWHSWSGLSIGAISFGQEVGVTSLQILGAINAIANGGYLVRPSLVDRVIDQNGDLVRMQSPQRKQVMRTETAQAIQTAFEGVVLRGTGKQAALEGYRAAGKTGTAQKIVDGHYSSTKYLASFIGFAPMPKPRISVLVWIDEPRGKIYGGEVSAPVFQRISQQALFLLHEPIDKSIQLPKLNPAQLASASEDYLPNATPAQPVISLKDGSPATLDQGAIVMRAGTDFVVVPDFTGMPKRAVMERCQELGIGMQPLGSGIAVRQVPPSGTRIPSGDACQVTFSKSQARIPANIRTPVPPGSMAQAKPSASRP